MSIGEEVLAPQKSLAVRVLASVPHHAVLGEEEFASREEATRGFHPAHAILRGMLPVAAFAVARCTHGCENRPRHVELCTVPAATGE